MLIGPYFIKRNPLEKDLFEVQHVVGRLAFRYPFRTDGPADGDVEDRVLHSAIAEKDVFTMGEEIAADDIHIRALLEPG